MAASTTGYDHPEPQLIRRQNGGWLAISGPGARVRVGVEGDTADEARQKYVAELAAWLAALDQT